MTFQSFQDMGVLSPILESPEDHAETSSEFPIYWIDTDDDSDSSSVYSVSDSADTPRSSPPSSPFLTKNEQDLILSVPRIVVTDEDDDHTERVEEVSCYDDFDYSQFVQDSNDIWYEPENSSAHTCEDLEGLVEQSIQSEEFWDQLSNKIEQIAAQEVEKEVHRVLPNSKQETVIEPHAMPVEGD